MTDGVIIATEGAVGRVRLDRPEALHALTEPMCRAIFHALEAWREEEGVRAILIDHASGRGFCAGGDLRQMAASAAGDGAAVRAFFRTEYQMNHRLFVHPKPIVAVMDGVAMGGGAGLALPARFRIATERTRIGFPESAIGLFPDVGGGWYLPRLPGRIGRCLALTGHALDGGEAMALGLATHFVPSPALEEVKRAILAEPDRIEAILDGAGVAPPSASIMAHRDAIDRLFAPDTVEEILLALEADDSAFAAETLATLRTRSPLACKVALHLLHEGALSASFADEMRREYAVATRVVQRPDFAEGVRARIIDKDHAPRWQPAAPEGVTDHVIDQIFAPLDTAEQWDPA